MTIKNNSENIITIILIISKHHSTHPRTLYYIIIYKHYMNNSNINAIEHEILRLFF